MYRMIIKTHGVSWNGRATAQTETVPDIAEDDVENRRETARQSAPAGSTRTIRVVKQH